MARKRKNAGSMYRASSKYKGEAKSRGKRRTAKVSYNDSKVKVGATNGGFKYLGKQKRDTMQGMRDVFVLVTPAGKEKHFYTENNAFARFNRIK
jgi:hypothetical protein